MADLDDLKHAWQNQSGIPQERLEQIGSKVCDSANLMQKAVFRRDMPDTLASIVMIPFLVYQLLNAKNWVIWIGCVILIVALAMVPFILRWARKRPAVSLSTASFRDLVDIEIDSVRRQVKLLRNVGWWGLTPLYVGAVVVTWGTNLERRDPIGDVIVVSILVLVSIPFLGIWWLNLAGCKKHFQPLLDYYVSMRDALENDDDSIMQLTDPPSDFLRNDAPRARLSSRAWRGWIVFIVLVTATVIVVGVAIAKYFDYRTGMFVTSTFPVVAGLFVFISGVWRGSQPRVPSANES